jgi:hypothetical protein
MLVEYAGFEPAISYVQGKRGLRTPLILELFVGLGRIELPLFESKSNVITIIPQTSFAEETGFEPATRFRATLFKSA